MVFHHSDLYPDNFIIADNGEITVIDFSDTSVLPSSFAKYSLTENRLGFAIKGRVYIPVTEGVDNTFPLLAAFGPMVMGSYSFAMMGKRTPGGDMETQNKIRESLEERGYATY